MRTHSQFDVYDIGSAGMGANVLDQQNGGSAGRDRSNSRGRQSLVAFQAAMRRRLRRKHAQGQSAQSAAAPGIDELGASDVCCWLTVRTVLTEKLHINMPHLSLAHGRVRHDVSQPQGSKHASPHRHERRWSQPGLATRGAERPGSERDQKSHERHTRWLSVSFSEPPTVTTNASNRDAEEGCLTDIDLTSSDDGDSDIDTDC